MQFGSIPFFYLHFSICYLKLLISQRKFSEMNFDFKISTVDSVYIYLHIYFPFKTLNKKQSKMHIENLTRVVISYEIYEMSIILFII